MIVTHYQIDAPVNLKAIVLADFHSSDKRVQKKASYVDDILQIVSGIAPDMIFAPGDIFNRTNERSVEDEGNKNGLHLLSECADIAPTFYSIGNHEHSITQKNRAVLEKAFVNVLDNSAVSFRGMTIGGASTGYLMKKSYYKGSSPEPDASFIERFGKMNGYKILLCHHPEYWAKYVIGRGIDLTVSGHAHGGQWGFFNGRGVYAPGQGLFPKYVKGLHVRCESGKNEVLAVSRGMRNTVPVPRIFNPCEILVLHLGDGV